MPIKMTNSKIMPIGVDLGSTAVKMIQLRYQDQNMEMIAAGIEPIPFKTGVRFADRIASYSQAIRTILGNDDFKSRQAVLSIPAEATFVQHLRIPKVTPDQLAATLTTELNGKIPYSVENAVIRHIDVGQVFDDGEPQQEIIAVAVERPLIDSVLSSARKAKLDVIGIEIESCAIVECFSRFFRRTADQARTVLYVDIGAASTQVVFSKGNHLIFARNLQIGNRDFDLAIAEGLKITPEQAQIMRNDLSRGECSDSAENELFHLLTQPLGQMSQKLIQCLQYHDSTFPNQSVERVIFLGGGAHDKRLCQALAQKLDLPAQIGDPLMRVKRLQGAGLAAGLDRRETQPDWAVAVGLSLGTSQKVA